LATIVHTNWLQLMLGAAGTTGTLPDFDTDTIAASLLDAADANGGVALTAGNVSAYGDVNDATVVANVADIGVSGVAAGVVSLTSAITFTSVTGDDADYLTVYKDTGTPSTSPLVVTWDSASTGLPVTPNGGDITATWGSSILVTLA
jgi:hypothetical protein